MYDSDSLINIFIHSLLQKQFEQLQNLIPQFSSVIQLFRNSLKPTLLNENNNTILSSILDTIDELPVSSTSNKQNIIKILTSRFHDIDIIVRRLITKPNLRDVSKDVNNINQIIFKTYEELFNQNSPSLM